MAAVEKPRLVLVERITPRQAYLSGRIAELIAKGMSNKAITAALAIAQRAAEGYPGRPCWLFV
ncbi:hypothetical protein [Nonomuraea sp. NPDC049141]|uniref:hypothetical protein n=1 Tax=unclassified Nonomuraea TaxID=2593643 RepID=UPI00340F1F4E